MKKSTLTTFIDNYNLNGLCEHARIAYSDGKLITSFQPEDTKDTLGFVAQDGIEIENIDELGTGKLEFGVFNTSILKKVLSIMNSDISLSLIQKMGKVTAMKLSDSSYDSSLLLADLDILDEVPKLNNLPEFEIVTRIDDSFITKFLKSANALNDTKKVSFNYNGNTQSLQVIFNHAEYDTDTITIEIPIEDSANASNINYLNFNLLVVKEILSVNKGSIGMLKLSSEGLLVLQFQNEQTGSTTRYVIVMLNI